VSRGLPALGLLVVLIAVGCGSTKTVTRTVTVNGTAKRGTGPPEERWEFGYVKSLTRKEGRYMLEFDPAQFLSGEAANVAAAQDGLVEPGEPVPNDNYVVNESKRTYTYFVAPNARVTVLKEGVNGSPITVAQLADIVGGENPFDKPLFEPIETGFWILVDIDTVRELDQQYKP
jgi:hypothetical protein